MLGIFPSKVSLRHQQSLGGWILIVCLGVWIQPASAQGAAAGVMAATVGQTATLTAPVSVNILTSAWYRGTAVAGAQLICTYFASPPRQVNGPQHTGRETCQSDGSLQIRDLLTNYTRNYTVSVQPNGENAVSATSLLMVFGTDAPPTGSPCPTSGSCWQTTLGVACGVVLGAAIIVAVMAVHYERRLKQDTTKDVNVYQNPAVIKNDDTQYENVKKGHEGQSANQGSAADPAYMELKHGDRATYEQIKRP